MCLFLFRRTPRRKLVFSSSDDEADDSPQSITSGTQFFLCSNCLLKTILSVLNVRQEYPHSIIQDEQYVFVFSLSND